VHRCGRAGSDGSWCDAVPGTDPALRAVPAGRRVPVARQALRAAPQAGAVRGLLPAAARRGAPPRCRRREARRRARPCRRRVAGPRRPRPRLGGHRLVTMTVMVATSLVTLLIPVWVLLGILVLFGSLALVARVDNGRYVRPLFALI